VPLARANFPVLEVTYTLWRKNAYSRIVKKFGNSVTPEDNRIFSQISERKYLPLFIEKLKNEMNVYCRGLKNIENGLKNV
jgi:hypothetical protein